MKRVVITGAGTINPLGHDVPSTLEAMREGRCAIGPLQIRDVERLSVRVGAQVTDYRPEDRFNRQQIALYDRFTQFTLIAADQALLDESDVTPDSTLESLGLDSLGLVETIFAMEEAFDISIPFNANVPSETSFDLSSVASIVAAIRELRAERV